MKVLLISDENKNITDALKSAELHVTDLRSAYEEIKKEAYDYIIAPPSSIALVSGDAMEQEDGECEARYAEKISELLLAHSGELKEYLLTVRNEVFAGVLDAAKAEELLCGIYSLAISNVFSENEWLELYLSQEDFEGNTSSYIKERLLALSKEYTSLFPAVNNDKTEEVILYILNNPESDLRQKNIASKMYVNSSYLSTVFAAQTGERFVDYLTSVKLRRAAYLLMNSTLRVSEIAARLDYKDIGYFSRLFRNHYGMPPSEYRIPDNYTYEI